MGKGNKAIAFQNGVANQTDCYVGRPDLPRHTVLVLVPTGTSTSDVYELAHVNEMVSTNQNQLKADEFDCEITFEHVSQTAIEWDSENDG